jgi:hypothetical protein
MSTSVLIFDVIKSPLHEFASNAEPAQAIVRAEINPARPRSLFQKLARNPAFRRGGSVQANRAIKPASSARPFSKFTGRAPPVSRSTSGAVRAGGGGTG